MPESVLVNYFYFGNVGHTVEALRHCLGYHLADPSRQIGLVLTAETPAELVGLCPFVDAFYPVKFHAGDLPAPDALPRLDPIPQEWDWILHDGRRYQAWQLEAFAGLRRYYETSDEHFRPRLGEGPLGGQTPSYSGHHKLRLNIPEQAREGARKLLPPGPKVAVLPAGSGFRARYPSCGSWELVLRQLRRATDSTFVLVGTTGADGRAATTFSDAERARLGQAASSVVDCFDLPIIDELAVIEACDVFLSPHSGMGFAAMCVDTPWAVISGGIWWDYFTNGVPFRSVIPDVTRYPVFTRAIGHPEAAIDDADGEGPRLPGMDRGRIEDDLDRIVAAVIELLDGRVDFETAMRDHARAARALLETSGQEQRLIWSFDGDLRPYLEEAAQDQ